MRAQVTLQRLGEMKARREPIEIEKVPQIRRDSGLHTAPGKNWDF
ncbi:hypothetical protein [Microbacterium aurantiacum]|nr:hypothetical protein [Microbacterium aurantiacum]